MFAAKPLTQGFTLVEMIVTILIIAIASVGITSSLSFALRHQSDGIWRTKAIALAEAYAEEIMARRFDENTPIGGLPPCSATTVPCSADADFDDGETRANFDDVDDYHNLNEAPPVDAMGIARSGYNNYRVQIQVAYASAAQVVALGLTQPTDAKVVTLWVTPPGQPRLEYNLVRGNF